MLVKTWVKQELRPSSFTFVGATKCNDQDMYSAQQYRHNKQLALFAAPVGTGDTELMLYYELMLCWYTMKARAFVMHCDCIWHTSDHPALTDGTRSAGHHASQLLCLNCWALYNDFIMNVRHIACGIIRGIKGINRAEMVQGKKTN